MGLNSLLESNTYTQKFKNVINLLKVEEVYYIVLYMSLLYLFLIVFEYILMFGYVVNQNLN